MYAADCRAPIISCSSPAQGGRRGPRRQQQPQSSSQDPIVNAPIERIGDLLMSSGAIGRPGASCQLSFVDLLRPVVDSAATVDMYAEMLMDGSASRMNPVVLINKYGSRVKSMRELNSFLLWLQLLRSECKVTFRLDRHRLAFDSRMCTEFVNPLMDAFVSYFNRPTPPPRVTVSYRSDGCESTTTTTTQDEQPAAYTRVDKLLFDYVFRKIAANEGRRLSFKVAPTTTTTHSLGTAADTEAIPSTAPPEAIAKFLDDTATACLVHMELAQVYPKRYFGRIVAAPT